MDINSVNVTGRLVRDMDLRYTKNNEAVGSFSIAINGFQKKNGSKEVVFLDCVLWGKVAESFKDSLKKGKLFTFNGRLSQKQEWTGSDGIKHDAKIYLTVQGLVASEKKNANYQSNENQNSEMIEAMNTVQNAFGGTFEQENIPF